MSSRTTSGTISGHRFMQGLASFSVLEEINSQGLLGCAYID
jgi:hypothetical protein